MLFGIFLIILGGAWLAQNLNLLPGSFWQIFWPLVLVVLGIAFLIRKDHWEF